MILKPHRLMSLVLLNSALAIAAFADQPKDSPAPTKSSEPREKSTEPAAAPSTSQPDVPSRADLEKEFRETLTGAVLRGTWQMTGEGGLKGQSALSAAAEDSYSITSVSKGVDDYWIINARIKFGDKDVTFPVPVRVVWAEDTPIITVNDLPVPGVGTYSARVMFFKGFYCGTWLSNAKNYGGVMSGRVYRDSPPVNPAPQKKD